MLCKYMCIIFLSVIKLPLPNCNKQISNGFKRGNVLFVKKNVFFFHQKKKLHSKYAHLVFSAEEYCCVGQTKFSDLTQSLPSMLPPPYVLKYAQFP